MSPGWECFLLVFSPCEASPYVFHESVSWLCYSSLYLELSIYYYYVSLWLSPLPSSLQPCLLQDRSLMSLHHFFAHSHQNPGKKTLIFRIQIQCYSEETGQRVCLGCNRGSFSLWGTDLLDLSSRLSVICITLKQ